jgi:flavin-dependent dehydrogenase
MNNSDEAMMDTQKNIGRHALVIGGSLAGLFAARVLADFFDNVTIIDRDVFPVTPDHRKGVHNRIMHMHCFRRLFPSLSGSFPVS